MTKKYQSRFPGKHGKQKKWGPILIQLSSCKDGCISHVSSQIISHNKIDSFDILSKIILIFTILTVQLPY